MRELISCDVFEADVIAAKLKQAGIWCHVQKDDCGGMRPSLGFVGGAKIFVQEKDVLRAQEMIKNEHQR